MLDKEKLREDIKRREERWKAGEITLVGPIEKYKKRKKEKTTSKEDVAIDEIARDNLGKREPGWWERP